MALRAGGRTLCAPWSRLQLCVEKRPFHPPERVCEVKQAFRLLPYLCSSVVPFFLESGCADTEEMKPQMNTDSVPGIS